MEEPRSMCKKRAINHLLEKIRACPSDSPKLEGYAKRLRYHLNREG